MAGMVAPIADERDRTARLPRAAALRDQAHRVRLDRRARRASRRPRARLSVGGLIKHVAAVERSWMDTVLQRDRRAHQDDYETNFRLMPDETLAGVLDRYDEVGTRRPTPSSPPSPTSARPCRYRKGVPWYPRRRRRVVGAVGPACT